MSPYQQRRLQDMTALGTIAAAVGRRTPLAAEIDRLMTNEDWQQLGRIRLPAKTARRVNALIAGDSHGDSHISTPPNVDNPT